MLSFAGFADLGMKGLWGEGIKGSTNYLRGVHGERGVRFWGYAGGPMHRSSPTLAWALFWDGGRIDKGGYQFLIVV